MERDMLDSIEHEKMNSRIAELELMVTELRKANFEMAKTMQQLDTDITNTMKDVKELCNRHASYGGTVAKTFYKNT